MSIAGLRKQINKANQFLSEKVGGAKGTEHDSEFVEMERRIDATTKLVDDLMVNVQELLQPNPTVRVKLLAANSMTKMGIRGQQSRSQMYPQPEGTMGETMQARAKELGPESVFSGALDDSGESFKQLAELRYALEENVKQNFLEPLNHTKKDIVEVNHHRKKLEGRRLDYDCKKRKKAQGTAITDEELRMAEEKFEESKRLTEAAMNNLIDSDVERIAHLSGLVSSLLEYNKQAVSVLERLHSRIEEHKNNAKTRAPRTRIDSNNSASKPSSTNNNPNAEKSADPWSNSPPVSQRTPAPTQQNTTPGSGAHNATAGGQSILSTATAAGAAAAATAAVSSVFQSGKSLLGQAIGKTTSIGSGNQPSNGAAPPSTAPAPGAPPANNKQACCRALYDFEPENPGELPFKEGDIINLDERLDENWFVGSLRGKTGHFPVNYVQVIVDLPSR